jgi:hypothetical protein
MSSEETDQPPPHDDEKGHTFRKWRLTIPMHQLELQAVEAAVEAMAAEVEVAYKSPRFAMQEKSFGSPFPPLLLALTVDS